MARVVGREDPRLRGIVVRVLRPGGIAIMPCDTIYGIVGVVPSTEARIRAAKGRDETKPLIQLIADATWLERLTPARPSQGILALWPGPLTLILPSIAGGTVGVRLPDDELLRSVMRDLQRPLYSTSANPAGRPALGVVGDIVDAFGDRVDLIVDGGDRESGLPSTVLDLTVLPHRIIRQGALLVPSEALRP